MRRPLTIALAAAMVWLGAWMSAARACSCAPPPPPLQAADASAAVFEGRVSAAIREGQRNRYPFTVTRVFKGNVGETIDVYSALHTCGRFFSEGTTYLVYAYEGNAGLLQDGLCTRTRTIASAGLDLAALGPGRSAQDGTDPADANAPTAEAPRIDPIPPPVAPPPKAGRCSVAELPHGHGFAALLALLALGHVAGRRRRDIR